MKREKYSPHREHCTCHLALREFLLGLQTLVTSGDADVGVESLYNKYSHILKEKS